MKNSDHDIIAFSAPAKMLGYSGERFTDAMTGAIDHEHRHRYLFALQFCQGKRVLDIASGEGYGSALLATVAKEVTGVDIDDETISHSRIAYSAPNLKFEVGDAMSIPLPDESVDIVVSFETIEHFEGHEKFLSEVRRVLAPGGMVIISSPIKEAYAANLEWKNPFHLKELTKNEFTALMGQHFSNVAYYEQMALMGSMILPASEANNASFTSFGRIDKHRFSRHTGGMNQALYAMIVASDIPLPSISPWGILEDNRYVEQLANIIRYNESLIATVQAEREQLKERNGYLVDAVNRAELRAEADARALAGQLAKLKKQVTGLNKRARALKKAVARRDKQLQEVYASTSWRLTRPVRIAMKAVSLAKDPKRAGELARIGKQHVLKHGIIATMRKFAIPEARARISSHLAGVQLRQLLTAQPSAAAAPANLPKPIKEAQATHPLYNESIIRPASMMLQPRILFVAEVSLAQCAKYRVWQKVEYFRKMGVDCTVLEWWRRDEIRNALQTHSLAIFYRTPGYPESLKLIAEARRLNVPTIWEVDDLIFDEQTYRANGNIDLLEPSLRDSVLAGVPLFRAALQACDYAIASTETLATEMVRAGAKEAFVIENALDTQTLIAAQVARSNRQVREEYSGVRIVYGSGSKAHDADFQTAAKALAKLMTVNQDVELHIIGDLTLPGAFDVFANRVVRRPFVDYETYLLQLAEADISLAPLEPTIFNDAKSNIKYLEAAVLGLPSVCSPRAAFRAEIEHGVNGFLAESEADWLSALTQLVVDKNLRAQVGSEALQHVLRRYSPDYIAKQQVEPVVNRFMRNTRKQRRVLIANIFFAPQSFGGATVVAEEMTTRLSSEAETEVAVFTSWGDPNAKPYDLVRFEARGATCFGVKLPAMARRSLEYHNPQMARTFTEVLQAFRPDVVHLHSIQGLSASIASACREVGIPYVITLHDAWWICERQFMIKQDGKYCFQSRVDLSVCAKCVSDIGFTAVRQETLQRILDGAALLLTPSAFHRSLYISNGIAPEKIVVNKNGVRVPETAPVRHVNGRIRFGFVGGIGPSKGSYLILEAFKSLTLENYELVLVDATLNLGFASITADGWDLPGTVTIVPAYTQDTMDAFFSNIDVLLFPSQCKESFGLTVREALSRNVWVIVTDSGGAAEDVIDGINGTIIPIGEDPKPLRDAIERLLISPEKLDAFINPARDKIVDFDSQAAELHDLLNSVATKYSEQASAFTHSEDSQVSRGVRVSAYGSDHLRDPHTR